MKKLAAHMYAIVLVLVAFLTIAAGPRTALADEPVYSPPRDVPVLLPGAPVDLPPIPADFVRHRRDWIEIAATPNAARHVERLLAQAGDVRAQIEAATGQPVLQHVEVRIGRSPEEMAALAPLGSPPPPYAEGVAYPPIKLVVLSLTAPRTFEATDLDEVFRHELVHVALEDAVAGHHVPRWFNEGFAVQQSGEHAVRRMHTLWDARMSGTLMPLSDLDRAFPVDDYEVSIAYAQSADFVRFLGRQADRARFASLIARVRAGQPFSRAMGDAYGSDLRRLEYQWRQEVDQHFTYWPMLAGGSLIWIAVFGALIGAYVKRRRASRATLARWANEEAAHDAAILAAQRALVEAEPRLDEGTMGAIRSRESAAVKVEHDGGWHTLH